MVLEPAKRFLCRLATKTVNHINTKQLPVRIAAIFHPERPVFPIFKCSDRPRPRSTHVCIVHHVLPWRVR